MRYALAAVILLCILPDAAILEARDEELLRPTPISRGVTANAYFYWRYDHDPELDFLAAAYGGAWRAAVESGLLTEMVHAAAAVPKSFNFIPDSLPGELEAILQDIQAVEKDGQKGALSRRLGEAITKLEWEALFCDEVVVGVHSEYHWSCLVVLARMNPDKAEKFYTQLEEVLLAAAEASPHLHQRPWSHGPARGVTLHFEDPLVPFQPTFGLAGDTFLFATHRSALETSTDLIFDENGGGDAGAQALVESERFRSAFEALPKAECGLVYMEPLKIFEVFMALDDTDGLFLYYGEDLIRPNDLAAKLTYRYMDLVSCIAYVEHAEEGRRISESNTYLSRGWKDSPLAKANKDVGHIEAFQNWIPRRVSSFSLSQSTNYQETAQVFHDLLIDIHPTLFPQFFALWRDFEEEIDFRFGPDGLFLINGKVLFMTFPAKSSSPLLLEEFLDLFELKDPVRARESLEHNADRLFGFLNQWLAARTGEGGDAQGMQKVLDFVRSLSLRFDLEKLDSEEMPYARKLTLSLFPTVPLVFGIRKGFFFIASSEDVMREYFDFLDSGGPTILDRPEFTALSLDPPPKLHKIAFSDRRFEHARSLSVLSLLTPFSSLIDSDDPWAEALMKFIDLIPLAKDVAQHLDFMQYEASFMSLDEERGIYRWRTVTTFNEAGLPR